VLQALLYAGKIFIGGGGPHRLRRFGNMGSRPVKMVDDSGAVACLYPDFYGVSK
jgi:hypothetical protein